MCIMPCGFTIFRNLSLIIFPRLCAGCGAYDEILCKTCTSLFVHFHSREISRALLVFSSARYKDRVRQAVLSWKDHDDEELTLYYACAMRFVVKRSIPYILDWIDSQGYSSSHRRAVRICVIPAPSSIKSLHERGRAHLVPLAQAATEELNECFTSFNYNISAHTCPCLTMDRRVGKSVTASGKNARAHRLDHKLIYHACAHASSELAILIDDIVTTGSTLRACSRTLQHNGKKTICAYVLANASEET